MLMLVVADWPATCFNLRHKIKKKHFKGEENRRLKHSFFCANAGSRAFFLLTREAFSDDQCETLG